jgi:regulator of protease activity HflC (stomatin/prohibitin superfamily)
MFDKLIDIVVDFAGLFCPFAVIEEYERGIVLTFGRYRDRTLEPGFHWIWPLGIDKVISDNVVSRTNNLSTQTLTTGDGQPIQLSAMIRWRIKDIVKMSLEVEDADTVLRDVTYGEIAQAVRTHTWDFVQSPEWIERVRKAAQKRGRKWGMEIEEVQLTDISKTKVIRLINAT